MSSLPEPRISFWTSRATFSRLLPAPSFSVRLQAGLVLVASLVLVVMAGLRQPPGVRWFEAGQTPFEHGPLRSIGPAFSLLRQAATVIPTDAMVVPMTAPRNPTAESYFHRAAVGLMPNQRILPAARWGEPSPEYEQSAEYLVVLGPVAAVADAELVFRSAQGAVWRRTRP